MSHFDTASAALYASPIAVDATHIDGVTSVETAIRVIPVAYDRDTSSFSARRATDRNATSFEALADGLPTVEAGDQIRLGSRLFQCTSKPVSEDPDGLFVRFRCHEVSAA